jgi:parallel beta-helix repeat protein
MKRRQLSKLLLASATASPLTMTAGTQAKPHASHGYPQTPQEAAGRVAPADTAYPPGDVRRYAADPTGRADSTSALRRAIASGHSLYFCDGDFLTSGGLSPKSGTTWWGTGRLKSTAGGNALVTASGIENFTFALSTDLSACSAAHKIAISVDGCSHVTVVDGRHIQGAISIATTSSCAHVTVARNTLLATTLANDTSAAAIVVNATSSDFSITDNEIVAATGAGIGVFNSSYRGIIARNRCISCLGSGIYINSGRYLVIEGNICNDNRQSGIGLNTAKAGTYGYPIFCTVTGNICAGNLFDGIDYNLGAGSDRHAAFSTVSGNVLVRNGSNATGGTGIYLVGVDEASIVGNVMAENNQPGIFLNGTEYCTVAGNGVAANGGGMPPGAGVGIAIAGSYNTVTGNTSTNHGGTSHQAYGISESNCKQNCIVGNTVSDNIRGGVICTSASGS